MQTPESLINAQECLKKAKRLLKEMEQSLLQPKGGDSKQKGSPSLIVLDFDLIASLRQQKRHREAENLLKIYHKRLKVLRRREELKIIDKKQIKKEDMLMREHERFLKRLNHICVRVSCTNDAETGKNYCQQCREKRALWRRKHNGIN